MIFTSAEYHKGFREGQQAERKDFLEFLKGELSIIRTIQTNESKGRKFALIKRFEQKIAEMKNDK